MTSPLPIPIHSENSTISSAFSDSSEPNAKQLKELQLRDESQKMVNRLQYDRTLSDSARERLITDLCMIDEELESLSSPFRASGGESLKGGGNG